MRNVFCGSPWRRLLAAWLVGVGAWAAGVSAIGEESRPPQTFCNPINLDYRFTSFQPHRHAADPLIVLFQGDYYLFASQAGGYWVSPNLRDWTLVAVEQDVLPVENWAPAAAVIGEAIYFVTSSRTSSPIYRSTDPKSGRWEKVHESFPVWDPALFLDKSDRLYLYWGCSPKNPLYCAQLDRNSLDKIGETVELFGGNARMHGWERHGDRNEREGPPWIEGPWMTEHRGTYYLQYATPGTQWWSYADGAYTSKSPTGPFVYAPYSPFSYKPAGFIGAAGHSGTFRDKHGNYWRISSMVVGVRHNFERRLGIFPAGFDADGVMYAKTALGDYPITLPAGPRDHLQNTSAGWRLLSYRKQAKASSTLPSHPVGRAFDENVRTWWSAATGEAGEWLSVDLGKPCRINAVQVNFSEQDCRQVGRAPGLRHQYVLQHSDDGENWSALVDKSKNQTDVPHDYVQLDKPVTARHVKLLNVHMPGGGKFAVGGLRIFGQGPGKAPAAAADFSAKRDADDPRNCSLTWNSAGNADNADGYLVRFGVAPEKLYSHYQVQGENHVELRCLNRGVDYYFTIDAFNENGYTKGVRVEAAKSAYRNVALNPNDVQGEARGYPHASSNSEYNKLPQFAARCAIDGRTANTGHGNRFPSWGPHKRKDLWWKVEFGRSVKVDRLVLYIRADFPHDNYWHDAAIEFSDGSREAIQIRKTAGPQVFRFEGRTATWLRLTDLVQSEPLGWCGLSEVEVWGTATR